MTFRRGVLRRRGAVSAPLWDLLHHADIIDGDIHGAGGIFIQGLCLRHSDVKVPLAFVIIRGDRFLHGVARKPDGFLRQSVRLHGSSGTSFGGEGLPRKHVLGAFLPMVLNRGAFPLDHGRGRGHWGSLAGRLMADAIE